MEYFRPPLRGDIGGLVVCGVLCRSRSDHGSTGKDGMSCPRIGAKKAREARSGFDRALCITTSSVEVRTIWLVLFAAAVLSGQPAPRSGPAKAL